MGNKQTTEGDNNSASNSELQNLTFVQKIIDERYGEISLMRLPNSHNCLAVKQQTFTLYEEYQKFLQLASIRESIHAPTVIRLEKIHASTVSDYCSSFFKIALVYEYIPRSLYQELERHRENQQFYTEVELIHLLDCVHSALIYLDNLKYQEQDFSITHEDIRPKNIFLSEDGIFKLNDIKFNTSLNQYKRFLMGIQNDQECYLAPEVLAELKHRNHHPKYDKKKADVFSLGLVILEAATLQNVQKIYDLEENKIEMKQLDQLISYVRGRYNQQIANLISSMLEPSASDRPDYDGVLQLLTPLQVQLHYSTAREDTEERSGIKQTRMLDQSQFNGQIDNLEKKFKDILEQSREIQRQYYKTTSDQNYQSQLRQDDISVIEGKTNEALKRSNMAREQQNQSVYQNQNEEVYDSSRLYEMYLAEYAKLVQNNQKNS